MNACVADPASILFVEGVELKRAQQKATETVTEFSDYLVTLEDQLDLDYTDRQSAYNLLVGLRPELREDIRVRGAPWSTRLELVALAKRHEGIIQDRMKPKIDKAPELQGRFLAKRPRHDRDPPSSVDLAKRNLDKGSRLGPTFARSGPDANATSGACFNCGDPGHWANKCTKPKTGSGAYGVRSVDINVPSVAAAPRVPTGKGRNRRKARPLE